MYSWYYMQIITLLVASSMVVVPVVLVILYSVVASVAINNVEIAAIVHVRHALHDLIVNKVLLVGTGILVMVTVVVIAAAISLPTTSYTVTLYVPSGTVVVMDDTVLSSTLYTLTTCCS